MKRPFLCMGALFVLGELAYRLLEENVIYSIATVITGIIICKLSSKSTPIGRNDLLLFLCLCLGALWALGYYAEGTSEELENAKDCSISLLRTVYVTPSGTLRDMESKMLLKGDFWDAECLDTVEPGTYLYVKAKVKGIEGKTNPGCFDMEQYYAGKGVTLCLDVETYSTLEKPRNYLVNSLYHIKCWLAERLEIAFHQVGEDDAAILKTMILGDRSDLGSETKILYQRSGIIHILAISGLHVALLARALEWLLARLRLRKNAAIIIVMLFAVLYGVMTGFSDATLRAVLMLIIVKVAFLLGRSPDLPTCMIEALLIMVVKNPDSLFSTGMLMSYMAVMGVITGEMLIHLILDRRSFKFLKKKKKGRVKALVEGLVISASINVWMLPLIMRTYYEVPIFSLLLNLIIVPLLTIVIVLGLLAALLGDYGFALAWACHLILKFYELACTAFISIPGTIIITGHIELWQMLLLYLLLGAATVCIDLLLRRRKPDIVAWFEKRGVKYWRAPVLAGIFALYLVISGLGIAGVKLYNYLSSEIVFLDVGQGDGSFIKSYGKCYIVDSGSTSNDSVGKYILIPALKYYGVSRVDCIFISHTDLDHINGVEYLLETQKLYGIKVENVAVARGTDIDENYSRLISKLGDTQLVELGAGDVVEDTFYILYPTGTNTSSAAEKPTTAGSGESTGNQTSAESGKSTGNQTSIESGKATGNPTNAESGESTGNQTSTESGKATGNPISAESGNVQETLQHSGNDYSLVMDYRSDSVEILYTGDISSDVEPYIINAMSSPDFIAWSAMHKSEYRLLKCPHHGSRYSSSTQLLQCYQPDITIISCGRHNHYGHPAPETLERYKSKGIEILRTDENGAVIIRY